MREVYTEVINSAFDAGMAEAWAFWDMSPAEISGRLRAHRAAMDAAMERQDALAWMVGLYVGKAYHNPKKYPKRPELVRTEKREQLPDKAADMDEDGMREMLTAFAEIHNAIEGAKP